MPVAARPSRLAHILFCDVKGFSKIQTDSEYQHFVTDVFGIVATRLANAGAQPWVANTWGDALMAAYDDAADAASAALTIRDAFTNVDLAERTQVHAELGVRVALHTGRVFQVKDPLTSRTTIIGRQVNLAARIEPIVAKNEVFATDAFVEMLRQTSERIQIIELGEFELPKGAGTVALSCLKWLKDSAEINWEDTSRGRRIGSAGDEVKTAFATAPARPIVDYDHQ